ncbi:nucleotide exchange factor GrpE [Candidatus Wolfebacteria bacterium]|nr:MAG: nucleotide exchange factor GrpE [Candidatus Wolfebacteria bacterium]
MPKKKSKLDKDHKSDDNDVVDIELEDVEEHIGSKLADVKQKLLLCKNERQEYLDGWQRERAEFANYKIAQEKARGEVSKYITEDVLLKFLPVLDSFDMAFSNKEAWERVDKNWRIGVEHIYSQMFSIFEQSGILKIDEIDVDFDPIYHQSVETIDTKNKEDDGKILSIESVGYIIKSAGDTDERVLRPARVKVFSYKK